MYIYIYIYVHIVCVWHALNHDIRSYCSVLGYIRILDYIDIIVYTILYIIVLY